jgi:hypothetical protein
MGAHGPGVRTGSRGLSRQREAVSTQALLGGVARPWRSRRGGGMTTRATPRGDADAVRLVGLFDSHDLWGSLTTRVAVA